MTLSLIRAAGERAARQAPFGVAVVLPSLLRADLARAVRSVFAQDFADRIQILVGIDVPEGDPRQIEGLAGECPSHVALDVFDPGYSTSIRHGGVHENHVSGSLRTILTFAANSRYIAYLDDDNWWAPNHLSSLRAAIAEADWSWSKRWFVAPGDERPICIDEWESVGIGSGVFRERFGGFVDPSSLMIDKLRCRDAVPAWANTPFADGRGSDRLVFDVLARNYRASGTGLATSFYTINPGDILHPTRLRWFRQKGCDLGAEFAGGGRSLARFIAECLPPIAADGSWAAIGVTNGSDPVLRELLAGLMPADALVLGDGNGGVALHLARALTDAGCAAPVLVVAPPGAAAQNRLDRRLATGFPASVRRLPATMKGLETLRENRVTTDLLRLGPAIAGVAELERLWPLLRPGGLMIGSGMGMHPIERFAAAHGGELARLRLLGLGPCWIIERGVG